jgi:hypothetical protein
MTMDITETSAMKIRGLCVEEISAVDVGANPQASILITKRSSATDVTKAAIYPAQQNYKSERFADLKSQPESEGYNMDEISKAAVTEAVLDALVLARQHQHPDETTPVAMSKILATEEGKKIYGEMVFAKDLEVAKATTLRTYGVKKVGSSSADTRAAAPASDAWTRLDEMAKQHSVSHGMPFHQSYAAIIGTPAGQKLYAAGLKTGAAA